MLEGAKILTEQPYVHSCETIDARLRLYVDSAATAIPQVMRALSNKGIEPGRSSPAGRASTTCSWPRPAALSPTDRRPERR